MYLFCDKTFVVRPTSDPKKLKFMKICQKLFENRQNTPLAAFLGVRPKIFLQNVSTYQYEYFWDQSFALKSKIKKFKIFRMLLAFEMQKSAESGPIKPN